MRIDPMLREKINNVDAYRRLFALYCFGVISYLIAVALLAIEWIMPGNGIVGIVIMLSITLVAGWASFFVFFRLSKLAVWIFSLLPWLVLFLIKYGVFQLD